MFLFNLELLAQPSAITKSLPSPSPSSRLESLCLFFFSPLTSVTVSLPRDRGSARSISFATDYANGAPPHFCFSRSQQQEGNSCSDGQLSGVMPDVAMATASFGALHLIEEQELELDLGDGASHLLPHVSPSGGGTIEPAAHRSSLPHQHQRHFSGPPPPPYVYHRAGTALPRFIWNLYTICGWSEQRGNYWRSLFASPSLCLSFFPFVPYYYIAAPLSLFLFFSLS